MTYEQFQRQLGRAGINVREFAELLRMNRNSVTNCATRGDVPAHLAVIVTLMALLAEREVDFREVLRHVDIDPKKPRGAGRKGRFGGDRQTDLPLDNNQTD